MTVSVTCPNAETSYKIYTGDTTDIVYVRPDSLAGAVIDSNWVCKQAVLDKNGNTVIASTTVTEKSTDSTEFKVYLTPTQTANITPSNYTEYKWVIQLSNDVVSPVIVRELHLVLGVSPQGIV